jgi:formylglycine-generating enzyme required for sulfatase activity
MPKIFISYRREDSEHIAGRLYDRLEAHFGRDGLFMDIDAIPFGVDFRKSLDQAVGQCDVLLAVIGGGWLGACHKEGPRQGQRRLDDPGDFVRLEIQSALARDIPVIPVLVGRASMPAEKQLPEGLQALAYRNAAEVRSGRDFRDHLDRLIRGIEFLVQQEESRRRAEQERQQRERARLQQEGESLLDRRSREILDRTLGKPTHADKATVSELCRQFGVPPQRANAVFREVNGQWKQAHPPRTEPRPGEVISNDLGMKFAWIPPGTFLMGSPPQEEERQYDETQHRVTLTKGFWLGVTLVSQTQWQTVMGNNPSQFKGDDRPVDSVSWDDCQDFCKRLGQKDGKRYRLPTEAEWEYACRAGTTTPFFFGDTISTDQANYDGNLTYGKGKKGVYREQTTPVGSFPANAWGLHDMHGNLYEWCSDWYGPYQSGDIVDPQGIDPGEYRVLRGGCWSSYPPVRCRSAFRYGYWPAARIRDFGCRVVLCLD